jgi:hypothetical protein
MLEARVGIENSATVDSMEVIENEIRIRPTIRGTDGFVAQKSRTNGISASLPFQQFEVVVACQIGGLQIALDHRDRNIVVGRDDYGPGSAGPEVGSVATFLSNEHETCSQE